MKVIFKGQEIELPVSELELTELIMVLHEYIPKPAPIFGQWRAGCGGKEDPFICNGTRWLYVWDGIDRHGYLNLDTDMIQEEHPRGKNW